MSAEQGTRGDEKLSRREVFKRTRKGVILVGLTTIGAAGIIDARARTVAAVETERIMPEPTERQAAEANETLEQSKSLLQTAVAGDLSQPGAYEEIGSLTRWPDALAARKVLQQDAKKHELFVDLAAQRGEDAAKAIAGMGVIMVAASGLAEVSSLVDLVNANDSAQNGNAPSLA